MLYEFLDTNRTAVVERWREKAARRREPHTAIAGVLDIAIPQFLGQVIATLRVADYSGMRGIPQSPGAAPNIPTTDIAAAAAEHGRELLVEGLTVEQVVHDYGDLGQAVAELAGERAISITPEELRTFSVCLDEAIADAVSEFGSRRELLLVEKAERAMSEKLGFLAHEQRNFLNNAILAFAAIKTGAVATNGATAAVLDRSLIGLRNLIDGALADVRLAAAIAPNFEEIRADRFIAELQVAANLEAAGRGCSLRIAAFEPQLAINADRQLLNSAASNLLQNAFKYTRPGTQVLLTLRAAGDRVLIHVEDCCGGLPPGKAHSLFRMFEQHGTDRSGLGLGLSISRRAVETCSGSLTVRDKPGIGCVFTIDVPRFEPPPPATVEARCHFARTQ